MYVLDDVDKDELEEYLVVLMDQEFDTILEDGSTVKVLHASASQTIDNRCSYWIGNLQAPPVSIWVSRP